MLAYDGLLQFPHDCYVVKLMFAIDVKPFWATVCKTVRPMLSVRCLPVLSVCDVRTMRPNGWTDQDETWHAVIGLGSSHIVLDGELAPLRKGAQPPPIFGYFCCGQMAAWIMMSLGMELGLSPGDIVLDGDPAPFTLLWQLALYCRYKANCQSNVKGKILTPTYWKLNRF